MDKRFALALGLSGVILFGWLSLQPKKLPPTAPTAATVDPAAAAGAAATPNPTPNPTPTPTPNPTPNPTAVAAPTAAATPTPAATPDPAAATPAPAPVEKPAEQLITVEEPGFYRAQLSTYGGAITSWELLSPQYVAGKGKDAKPIQLAHRFGSSTTLTISSVGDLPIPPDAIYVEEPAGANQKRFVYDGLVAKVTKTYTFQPKTYEVAIAIKVESKLDRAAKLQLALDLPGFHDPNEKGGFLSPNVFVTEGACHIDNSIERENFEKVLKEPINKTGKLRWGAMDRKFFVAAVGFAPMPTDGNGICQVAANSTGNMVTTLTLPERLFPAKGVTEYELGGFFGPKLVKELDTVRVGNGKTDIKLGDVMNYGRFAEFFARPLLAVLRAVQTVVPNWGFAIILLTILVKAALWIPTQKSMESMKKVAALKPQMDKLKERYGDDKNALNMATMELYRKEGVNPAGGCLPMLVQFPIFIGLFSMLGTSVELYRAPFISGWIGDLTQPDPYYILPIMLGGLMYLQQKVSPVAADPNQKTMMYGMQAMFVMISLFYAAGLTLYSITNTVTSLLQQYLTNRKNAKADADKKSSGGGSSNGAAAKNKPKKA